MSVPATISRLMAVASIGALQIFSAVSFSAEHD